MVVRRLHDCGGIISGVLSSSWAGIAKDVCPAGYDRRREGVINMSMT